MKKKTSLKDIADKVGVSIALVSYVLNGQKLDRISKTVAEKIKEAARELNYRTNQIARSLKTSRTHTVGLIVSDISNSFSSSLARFIEDEAEKYGYTVIFGSSDEIPERSQRLMNVLVNHQVDGLIISPTENSREQLEFLVQNEIPFILLDRYYPTEAFSYIAIDNYQASYNLTQHLVQQGRQRIAFIGYNANLENLQERKRGYLQCLADNGIESDDRLVKELHISFTPTEVQKAVAAVVHAPTPPDGLVFASNTLSLNGLRYLNTQRIRVPDDLALVAFDESAAADLFYAPLTHIKQPLKQMGQMAFETLINCIEKRNCTVQAKLPAELVVRKSSVVSNAGEPA